MIQRTITYTASLVVAQTHEEAHATTAEEVIANLINDPKSVNVVEHVYLGTEAECTTTYEE